MRMQRVETESDLPDLGIKIVFQVTDNNVEAVIIGEGEDQIRITKASSYSESLKITRPQQKTSKKVYVVVGKLLGIADYRSEEFEKEYEASHHYNSLESNIGLEIKKETVYYYEDKI
jgi:hypothetical protein